MSEDNVRKKAIKLLQMSSAAMVESYERGLSGSDSVARSNVYLKEYVDLMSSSSAKKIPFNHQTKLTAIDFFKEKNVSCCLEPSEKEIKALVSQFKKKDIASPESHDQKSQISVNLLVRKSCEEDEKPKKKLKVEVSEEPKQNLLDYWKTDRDNRISPQSNAKASTANAGIPNPFKKEQNPFKSHANLKPSLPQPSVPNKYNNNWNEEKKVSPISNIRNTFSNTQKQLNEQENVNVLKNKGDENVSTKKNDPFSHFKTGRQEFEWQKIQQNQPKLRGLTRNTGSSINRNDDNQNDNPLRKKFALPTSNQSNNDSSKTDDSILKGFDKAIMERIEREIVSNAVEVTWNDIVGLDNCKKLIDESITMAIKHPEFFTGLRETPRAILLFGPPGTGKTLIGKCIASSCSATFMSISASSLTSKWIGESETLVRALFAYAKLKQPCVIFFDEIDSLLEKRDSDGGNQSLNRIKTEFLVQLDGVNALTKTDRVLFIAATNLPHKIDEAILRRFSKRILIPLPVKIARMNLFMHLLSKESHTLTAEQFDRLAEACEGYSGSDIAQVCKEAAMMPFRKINTALLDQMSVSQIPPIIYKHFVKALKAIKASVSIETISLLNEWNSKYGFSANSTDTDSDDDDDDDEDY